ncbi:MAG TPA: LuxR C-terminal-related transcriptional regulator [Gemmatimonadaceae bacterium]|nr:LuxR C-terminal-related transcriptional regulator [Gemmatimonadaceae bacterium]
MHGNTTSGSIVLNLLERGPVLLELSHFLADADKGHGRLVFVGGEAGVGKTWVLRRFAELIRDRSQLLIGSCDPLSTPRPLGPLLDVADRLGNGDIDLSGTKDEIFRDLLAAVSSTKTTTVLAFEDVHWADEATLDLLRFVARRIEDRRAVLIATFRNDEVGDLHPLRQVLGDTATAPGARRLTLNPLSISSVRTMAAGSGVDVNELYRQTGGNPFFVSEVLATPDELIPPTVRDAVIARVARLSARARAVLEAASAIGFRSEPWLLNAMTEADAEGIEECLQSGVLIADDEDGTYIFRHELGRIAVLDTVVTHRRQDLNRRILDELRKRDDTKLNAARLAHHADEAGDIDAVIAFAPEAARRSSALSAHRDAIAHYQRALRFTDHLPPNERAEILEEYARECAATDKYDEAITISRQVVDHWHDAGDRFKEADILGFLSGCLVSNARVGEAQPLCSRAIELLEQFPRGAELAEAYVRQSRIEIVDRQYDDAIRWSQKALDIAEEIGDVRARVLALHRFGSATLLKGDDEGERILKFALSLALGARIPVEASGVYLALAANLFELYEFNRAAPYLEQSLTFADEHQLGGFLTPTLGWYSLLKMYQGQWAEVEEPAYNVLNREHVSVVGKILALTALGRLYTRKGDSRAAKILDDALALAEPTRMVMYLPPVRAARAEAAWLAGDLDGVKTEAQSSLELTIEKRHPWFAGELLSWLAITGEPVDIPEWIAPAFGMQIAGDWQGAAEEWKRRGCPYEAAQALLGSDDETALRDALEIFESLTAEPAAKHARRDLRELGVRGIPRGPHESTRSNSAGLTRREIEIVQLLSEGLRNNEIAERLFLSPKTVDHHVSSVLSKLGVKARAQVRSEAERRGLLKNGEPEGKK